MCMRRRYDRQIPPEAILDEFIKMIPVLLSVYAPPSMHRAMKT